MKRLYVCACKSKINPRLFTLSRDINTTRHHYRTTDTISMSPPVGKVKRSLRQLQLKVLNLKFSKMAEHRS